MTKHIRFVWRLHHWKACVMEHSVNPPEHLTTEMHYKKRCDWKSNMSLSANFTTEMHLKIYVTGCQVCLDTLLLKLHLKVYVTGCPKWVCLETLLLKCIIRYTWQDVQSMDTLLLKLHLKVYVTGCPKWVYLETLLLKCIIWYMFLDVQSLSVWIPNYWNYILKYMLQDVQNEPVWRPYYWNAPYGICVWMSIVSLSGDLINRFSSTLFTWLLSLLISIGLLSPWTGVCHDISETTPGKELGDRDGDLMSTGDGTGDISSIRTPLGDVARVLVSDWLPVRGERNKLSDGMLGALGDWKISSDCWLAFGDWNITDLTSTFLGVSLTVSVDWNDSDFMLGLFDDGVLADWYDSCLLPALLAELEDFSEMIFEVDCWVPGLAEYDDGLNIIEWLGFGLSDTWNKYIKEIVFISNYLFDTYLTIKTLYQLKCKLIRQSTDRTTRCKWGIIILWHLDNVFLYF